ncbi:hypothetical protein [Nitrobacter sp.]|uniref:hypothetical protein n=1 Tax=Nitrobacter sp. TaxID=29420 RepID=UPI0029CAB64C|nr:hypothetical protein [Nitrobacter sp.]
MTYRKLGALVVVGAIALVFATNEGIARTDGVGAAAAPRAGIATVRPPPHAFNGLHRFRHRGRNVGGYFWPGYGDAYGAYIPTAEPIAAPLAGPQEFRYTTIYDVPWDWVHRFPPNVIPSDRPYVPSCGEESVGVGAGKTVNVIRCY